LHALDIFSSVLEHLPIRTPFVHSTRFLALGIHA